MRPRMLAFTAALAATLPASAQEPGEPTPLPPGFKALFDGKDLAGWHGMPHVDPRTLAAMPAEARAAELAKWTEEARQHWSVADGALVNDGKGAYLTTDGEYGDVELRVDYQTVPKADSGIYLRTTPQVQIWDTTEAGGKWPLGAAKGSGGLWNNSEGAPGKDPLRLADKPFGSWNRLRVIQAGARTTVYLNGQLVVDHATMENFWDRKAPLPPRGLIQLQTHGGEIRWRNVFLKELTADEANKTLMESGNAFFTPIFNGKDLAGWAGAVDSYEVVDGAIRCKPDRGGNLYFNKEYADFAARLEFRLPPKGNNGLLIRYPGEGDGAYVGACELQVLDDSDPAYAKLDPRQSHGSAYGMAAAARGYLRPVGQWNFQEVTVKGSRVKVELNGTVILEADLKGVTDFMAKSPHPGKDRASGYFGFAGHKDPVEFRSVAIKPLD